VGGKLGLTISILADAKQLQDGLGGAGRQVEVFGKSVDLGMVAKLGAVAGAAGIAVDAIAGMTEAAIADAQEADQLTAAIQAAGAATGDYAAQVDQAIEAAQARAFTDTEVRQGLTALVGVTGDVGKATELLATAQDLARLKGVDLKTASEAVAKAQGGQATQLARLVGISAKGKDATDVLTEAQRLAAGQADTYGNSLKGQLESAGIGFDELQETIGSIFIPVLQAVIPAVMPVLRALGELVRSLLPVITPLLQRVADVLRVVSGVVVRVAEGISGLVQWLGRAIQTVGRFLESVNPLRGLGDVLGNVGRAVGLRAAGAGMAGQGAGGLTVHVYGGDTRAIQAAVASGYREWTRTNGADAPTRGW
jgi:hypothetical protein